MSEQLTRSGVAVVDNPDGSIVHGLLLKLSFFDVTATVTQREGHEGQVWFEGALPAGVGRATFTHQGAMSVIAQLREQKLGIDVVDAAFIVFCDDDAFAVLNRCREELKALVPDGKAPPFVQLHLESDKVRILWDRDDVAALPALWERLVSVRTGA
jgi:hypothetical protein